MTDRYDAILFDFDGVLIDSEPLHFDCWKQVLAPFGVELSWDVYAASCIGVADRVMIRRFADKLSVPFDELWDQYPRKKELFRSRMEATLTFHADTIDLVRELSDHLKLAVVSSSARAEVEPVLISGGLRDFFKALVCGNEVEHLKPAPDPYLRAAELLEASKPLVVEDSDAGEQSGQAAGFDVLRIDEASSLAASLRARL
jgi:HAD superfamily hydrolase (TIGR01509 family)